MAKNSKSDSKPEKKAPVGPPRPPKAIILCIVGLLVFTAFDLWTKDWALATLAEPVPGGPHPICQADDQGRIVTQNYSADTVVVIEGYAELRYAENCGAAFGMMRDFPSVVRHTVFGIAAVIASIALGWMFFQGRGGAAFAWSVPLIVSGALGNLVDRVRYGYVVDFIRLHLENGPEWPTFNVADSTITVGVALLLVDGYLEGRREKSRQAEEAAAATSAE